MHFLPKHNLLPRNANVLCPHYALKLFQRVLAEFLRVPRVLGNLRGILGESLENVRGMLGRELQESFKRALRELHLRITPFGAKALVVLV